jgi:hypothetical protein
VVFGIGVLINFHTTLDLAFLDPNLNIADTPLFILFEKLLNRGSATWFTTHVCSTVSTTVVSDPLLL